MQPHSHPLRHVAAQILGLLTLACLLSWLRNTWVSHPYHLSWSTPPLQTPPLPQNASTPPSELSLQTDPNHPLHELSDTEAPRAFQARIPFLDARRSEEFSEGHIPGAWPIPVWESDIENRIIIFEAQSHASSEDPLVIYCNGGGCEDSSLLAQRLMRMGYRNLWIYHDGYPEWVKQGREIERGARP